MLVSRDNTPHYVFIISSTHDLATVSDQLAESTGPLLPEDIRTLEISPPQRWMEFATMHEPFYTRINDN